MRKTLSVVLFISGLMPLFLGLVCLMSYPTALQILKLSGSSGDVFQGVTLFGICLLPLALVHFIAGYWTWKENSHGIALARIIGFMLLLNGILMNFILHRPDLAMPDFFKGIVISVLVFFIVRRSKK